MRPIKTIRRVTAQKGAGRLVPPYGLIVWLCSTLILNAAEIHLRSECHCTKGLVRLGDVAEIRAADAGEAAKLGEIELCAAPASGSKSFVRAREIQDLLALRGLNLTKYRLSGASQVEIRTGGSSESRLPITASIARRTTERVQDAIATYLERQAPDNEGGWQVELQLSDDQVRTLSASKNEPIASGGEAPWVGNQEFVVTLPTEAGEQSAVIAARVTPAPRVVVATRALVPGEIVQAPDVKLAQIKPGRIDSPFFKLEEVVGQETKRAIVVGQAFDEDDLRSPLLVRRGDAVTVYARSAGIRVRTPGRANEDGSRGDVIVVESILNRERFHARVSGIREVEVYAEAAEAATVVVQPAKPTAADRAQATRLAQLLERTEGRDGKPLVTADRRSRGGATANRGARLDDSSQPSTDSPKSLRR